MLSTAQIFVSPSPAVVGDIISCKFVINSILRVGCNCFICSAMQIDNHTAAQLAVKFEKDEPDNLALITEYIVQKSIFNMKHFAKIIEFGHRQQFNFIITQLLGPSLRDLALRQQFQNLSLQTLLKFAYQAIESLQTLHQAGFVHGAVNAV
ncbi:MAG: hypothetical protein EZS28_029738 [Streblomastix strix]|uniref:Protein kinase domain-containing protein n=1 Tax=Streblomastix strix TaxID=222440 RepID=A0A5J4UYB1_9EUKA|nr:MAG: hypothetical protein EZS28_029738 [Streblomastix strix]